MKQKPDEIIGTIYGVKDDKELYARRVPHFHLFTSTPEPNGRLVLQTDKGQFFAERKFLAKAFFQVLGLMAVDFENHTVSRISVTIPWHVKPGDNIELYNL